MSAVIQVTWIFSTLLLLLNWLNQHWIALLTKGSLPHAQWKLHSTVTLDLLSANEITLCFLLHACQCTNCGSGSAYYSWKCMCMYMKNVSKEAYWHVSENFLSSWTCYSQFHLYISLLLKVMSKSYAGPSFWSKRVWNNISQGMTVLLSTHNPKTQDYCTQRNS